MNINFSTKYNLANLAGKSFSDKIKNSSGPKLLLLSGGSSFAILDFIDTSLLGPETFISMSDERYSNDSKVNNFLLLKDTTFYKRTKENGCEFIDTSIYNGETIEELASRFETSLRKWLEENPKGKVFATMGMGPDGHTCGIMPYPENHILFDSQFNSANFVVGYDAKDKNEFPLRITVTIAMIKKIDEAVMYVSGENKGAHLKRVLEDAGTLAETPARIWKEIKNVEIFTDITEYSNKL
jgi:6-phosphogluconolactonase/glucosamine-6-phosphate isomerase/deaminase